MTTRKVLKAKDKGPPKKFANKVASNTQAQQSDARMDGKRNPRSDAKIDDLQKNTEDSGGEFLTTNQGVRVNDNQNSLKAGDRGATLLEDFILREKITHFDHERIPERVVHARGSAAHGFFQVYESMAQYTKAGFLQDPKVKTPVFVRFSTVAGSRGSTDLARDVRGFAVKFYTQEGNFDIVGNNIPVFWDFISLMPESMHMIMWVMSDRAIPRSLRMMEGFGVHTFRFINEKGKARFVKFHWKPMLGVHSVVWDEAQKISGKDPDFHRRDLWEAIENGDFPEWEFGVQIVEEKDEHSFDFDLLDPTKIIPEEVVPVRRIGKLTLNRNPDNFFAETEQVAFHVGNVVPGIDFTNDPLMQGRLFSYTDTQLIRLGGPNFHEIPINRPVAPVHNNQRDGFMRQTVNRGQTSYDPNTLRGGCPFQAGVDMGGFTSYAERIDAQKIRARSASFFDHFSQATLFFNSQSEPEKGHIIRALRFELGKLETPAIRERMLGLLAQVDEGLANSVAEGLGLKVPAKLDKPMNMSVPADGDSRKFQPKRVTQAVEVSPALSMVNNPNFPKNTIKTRKIAVLLADGFDDAAVAEMNKALLTAGATPKTVAPRLGVVTGANGEELKVDFSFLTGSSVLFDAVYIPGGDASVSALKGQPEASEFVSEAYKHCKAIAASGAGVGLLATAITGKFTEKEASGKQVAADGGVVSSRDAAVGDVAKTFITAIARHRHWERENSKQ
jgi:catalase